MVFSCKNWIINSFFTCHIFRLALLSVWVSNCKEKQKYVFGTAEFNSAILIIWDFITFTVIFAGFFLNIYIINLSLFPSLCSFRFPGSCWLFQGKYSCLQILNVNWHFEFLSSYGNSTILCYNSVITSVKDSLSSGSSSCNLSSIFYFYLRVLFLHYYAEYFLRLVNTVRAKYWTGEKLAKSVEKRQ